MTRKVTYLAGAEADENQVLSHAKASAAEPFFLQRRGVKLGWICKKDEGDDVVLPDMKEKWQASNAVFLKGFVKKAIVSNKDHIKRSLAMLESVLDGDEIEALLEESPYIERIEEKFEMLGVILDEGDSQEIEKIEFDAMIDGEVDAENLWLKASWLSYEDDDVSLRFRFSFGMEGYEDVGADLKRELYAAELSEVIFPESKVVTENKAVSKLLQDVTGLKKPTFVERIIYFNAPNGGALFHQDVERGHAGVIFAQLHGRTGWLALSKAVLLDELIEFLSAEEVRWPESMNEDDIAFLQKHKADREVLSEALDNRDSEALEKLLNRTPSFVKQLVERGYAYVLEPGDVLLLPQSDYDECAWHTVFCLDDFPGHALSFAIREG